MAKIEFNVKYRPQIESGEYKVETRDGRPVRIICLDRKSEDGRSIVALVNDGTYELCYTFQNTGRFSSSGKNHIADLFIITPEPELAEDERIRKFFAELATDACGGPGQEYYEELGLNYDKVMGWLEKHKEQKHAECNKESKDKPILTILIDALKGNAQLEWALKKAGVDVKRLVTYIEEQKSAEWREDYREEDLRTRFAFYTYKDEDDVLYLSNVFVEETSRNKGFGTKILAAAEKVAETLGAINIRLKVKQNSPANAWYRKNGYGYLTFEGDYDWLEKTLEYLKPSKKEWSEEDEKNFYWISTRIQQANMTLEYTAEVHEILSWLKSLRPQPHWKPSEEQMEVFLKATPVNLMPEELYVYNSLCNDIQKLM